MTEMLIELWKEWFNGSKESFDRFEVEDLHYFPEDRYIRCLATVGEDRDTLKMILNRMTKKKEAEGRETAWTKIDDFEKALQKQ